MPQYDIFQNPNKSARRVFPYIIVLQSDVSLGRKTVVAAPIARRAIAAVDDRASIPVEIDSEAHVVMIQGLAAIPQNQLGRAHASAPELRDRLPRAIDYLFLGL